MVLSAIPTQYMRRRVWKRLKPTCPERCPIVSVAKGIENETLLRPTQIIADVLGGENWSAMAFRRGHWRRCRGPNIAAELAAISPGERPCRRRRMEALARRVQSLFRRNGFASTPTTTPIGVELAGATKNVIAIAAGILDGLAAGNNAKAALVTRGLVEITRLGVAMGRAGGNLRGLAGLGDLITTCVSPEGRNRTVGERSARAEARRTFSDAWTASPRASPPPEPCMQLARRSRSRCPSPQAVYAVLFEGKDVIHALTDLMSRDPKAE